MQGDVDVHANKYRTGQVQRTKEKIEKRICKHRELAIAGAANYFDAFYNGTRRHSRLGGLSHQRFEATHKVRRQSLRSIMETP